MSEQASSSERDPTAAQVLDYLRAHPDFLADHPDLLAQLVAPNRALGEGVADFQAVMIDRLRGQMDEQKALSRELIDTSRQNLSTTAQIHECVLRLLAATSFEQVIQTVTTDFAVLLDVDVVVLALEGRDVDGLKLNAKGVRLLTAGSVANLFGGGSGGVRLRSGISGDPEIYGGAAPLVQSDALVRLSISDATPPALIAFASRHPDRYHPGQATELLAFLGQVLERVVCLWLDLPE